MPREIPVDLVATGGSLTAGLPGYTPKPGTKPPPGPEAATAAAAPAEVRSEAPPAPPPIKRCGQCGLDPHTGLDHLTATDELEFVGCVLRGEPFQREYPVFGGAVRVLFRDITPDVGADVMSLLDKEGAEGKFPTMTLEGMAMRFDRSVSLMLGLAVTQLVIGKPITIPSHTSLEAGHSWLVQACKSEVVYRAVREAYLKFSNLLAAIGKRALDPSFSKATAGGG